MDIRNKIFEHKKTPEKSIFDEVYDQFFDKVLGFIKKIVKNEEDAIDIAQEVFLKLWESRDRININSSLSSYIYTSAKNRALNYLRSKKVERIYAEYQAEIVSDLFDTQAHYNARDTLTSVKKCVLSMPEPRREIFILSRKGGLTNDGIAAKLGISIKTVEYHISKALKELRTIIQE